MPVGIETAAVSIGGLLRLGTTYKVPMFQRDYSWTEEEYGRLWDDINDCIDNQRSDYFIGSVVVNDATPAQHLVIDGQQRLASISALICALRDVARKLGQHDFGTSLDRDFLGRIDYATGQSVPKLELNKTNRRFYIERIFTESNPDFLREYVRKSGNNKSNRQLASAYMYYRDKVEALVNAGLPITKIIAQTIDAIENRLTTIKIAVKDDNDAYLLFETLNDRGLSLSVSDLLKNYIFSLAKDQLFEVQENWEEMVSSLEQHDIASFLRHYWLSKDGVIRDKDLYRRIAQDNKTTGQVINLSKNLRDAAAIYGRFTSPDDPFWHMFSGEERRSIKSLLDQLILFNLSQCYPLMLSSLDSNPDTFHSVLKMIVVFSFRYSVIGNLGTGNLEKAYSNAALLIRQNPNAGVKEIFERLRHLYPLDGDFKRMFSEKTLTKSAIARYVLAQINDFLTQGTGLVTDRDPSDLNLEHILPKRVSAYWRGQFNGDDELIRSYVDRLGNMTLLTSRLNKAVSNGDFDRKRNEAYKHKPLKITEPLVHLDKWSGEEIEKRQIWMADIACKIWRIDY